MVSQKLWATKCLSRALREILASGVASFEVGKDGGCLSLVGNKTVAQNVKNQLVDGKKYVADNIPIDNRPGKNEDLSFAGSGLITTYESSFRLEDE